MSSDKKLNISENSSRIAKNTLLLYFRMLLMMFIGLFTSRIVLDKLGVSDYGIWNAVGGVVASFTCITAAISNAISRFLAFEIGKADREKLKRVFASGVIIQIGLSILLIILVETVGMWLLGAEMNIPAERLGVAKIVLHCSLAILVINMLAIPFNATIVAHEKMSAFALISIVEAVLKLSVAILLSISSSDKLILYSLLMVGVALIVRLCYSLYCRRNFEESRAKLQWDKTLLKEMSGFAGWSFIGSGVNVLNTQGVSVVVNIFFGVIVNAARGVAAQVEGIVKQFATNFLTALNPQITKSWASGNKKYCFELVGKGAKFTFLILFAFFVPLFTECEILLGLWLKEVPPLAVDFTRLTLIALLIDMTGNPLLTLQLATGNIRRYYLWTGLCALLCLPLVWLFFSLGASPQTSYIVLIGIYTLVFGLKLVITNSQAGFPAGEFVVKLLLPLLLVAALTAVPAGALYLSLEEGILRLALVCVVSWLVLGLASYIFVLTPGEREFLLSKLRRPFFKSN